LTGLVTTAKRQVANTGACTSSHRLRAACCEGQFRKGPIRRFSGTVLQVGQGSTGLCVRVTVHSTLPADRPTKEEVREAERALILYAQREEYTQELKFLNDKRPIPISAR